MYLQFSKKVADGFPQYKGSAERAPTSNLLGIVVTLLV